MNVKTMVFKMVLLRLILKNAKGDRTMLLIEKMKHKEDFTALERQISEYILEHRNEIFELSLAEFSKRLYVSKATMIRYFKKLGFASYRELCVELAKELSLYENGVPGENGTAESGNETAEDIAKRIQMVNTTALAISYEYLGFRDVEEIADIIRQYSRIYIYGYGEAGISAARIMNAKLIAMGKDTTLIRTSEQHAGRYRSFDRKSIAIFCVYNDAEGKAAAMAKDIHSMSLPVLLISGPFPSEIDRYAYRSLRTMYTEEEGADVTSGSVSAMEYLGNVILEVLKRKLKQQLILK